MQIRPIKCLEITEFLRKMLKLIKFTTDIKLQSNKIGDRIKNYYFVCYNGGKSGDPTEY